MSYVKLFKVVQDTPVGYQSVNQAIDNNAALRAQLGVRHHTEAGLAGSAFRIPGKHNDIRIPRSVARITVDTARATPTLVPIVSGPVFGRFAYTRLAAGQWRIFIAAPRLVLAVAQVEASSAIDRKANAYTVYDPSTGTSVVVTTWDRSGGSWAKTDLDFSLCVWCDGTPI